MATPEYWAHTPSKKNPHWHLLMAHVLGVTEKAETFAKALDNPALPPVAPAWARYLGLLHDLGKFTDKFQKYLWECHLADKGKGPRPVRGSAPHKQMGAIAALEDLKTLNAGTFALPLYGHHGGMQSPSETHRKSLEKTNNAEVKALQELAAKVDARLVAVVPDIAGLAATDHVKSSLNAEMFLRLLFSCLTDADALDTEAHNNPDEAQRRETSPPPDIKALRDVLRSRQQSDFVKAPDTVVNKVRREVYDACIETAINFPPGVFDLTVPTGGGKTRSSLAFALEHAAKYDLRRVIYAIPYTSIVDQTAQVFRDLFGDDPDTILEHHSAIDPNRENEAAEGGDGAEQWRRLAAQNWDAPLIVTTTVQLFESLFSNRPAACRKLHRIARSVIVLDEVQTLPAHLLTPLINGLKILAANFGVTVVLCTATQPALQQDVSRFLDGFDKVWPIVADPKRHFEALRRVHYQVHDEKWEWPDVAEEMQAGNGSCLCIVNTRRQARELMSILDPDRTNKTVFHLSTLMCGQHRRKILREVSQRLKDKLPTLLVSTTVVECGVDLDFPRVLRAVGPLDRIIQAAGRCNREGRRSRDESEVVVFTPADEGMPKGIYQMALRQTVNLFERMTAEGKDIDLDDPTLVTRYFARLYSDLQAEVDAKDVQKYREQFDYREVADRVKLIEEDTVSVLVSNYDVKKAETILNQANAIGSMTRALWQRAQPLCVSLRRTAVETGKAGVDLVPGGLYVWHGDYDAKTGIPLPEDMAGGPVYQAGQLIV